MAGAPGWRALSWAIDRSPLEGGNGGRSRCTVSAVATSRLGVAAVAALAGSAAVVTAVATVVGRTAISARLLGAGGPSRGSRDRQSCTR